MPNLFQRLFGSSAKQVQNSFNRAFYGTVGDTYTSYDTNAETYLNQGYLFNSTVYSIISQRAKKAQQVPFFVKKIKNQDAKKRLDAFSKATKGKHKPQQTIKKKELEQKAFTEELLDFPMLKPNETQTWGDIISLYETFIATTGNFYLYKLVGDFSSEPLQVYVLPSHLMEICLKSNASLLGTENPISHYMLIEGDRYITFDVEEVIHVKLPNPDYGLNGEHLYGLSPLKAALRNIQSSNQATDNNINTMLNNGAFGFLTGKGAPLTEGQAREVKSKLLEMSASKEELSNIAGASAELQFTKIGLNTDELKPFDFLQWDEKQLCNVLGWSTVMLNSDKKGDFGGTITAEERRVVSNTIMPSLQLLEESLNDNFLPLFKSYDNTVLEFDFSELPEMQQDIADMVDWLVKLVNIGVFNRDEAREYINMTKLETEEMTTYTVQQDVIPLTESINEDFRLNDQTAI